MLRTYQVSKKWVPSNFGYSDTKELLESIYTIYTEEQEAEYTVLGIKIQLMP